MINQSTIIFPSRFRDQKSSVLKYPACSSQEVTHPGGFNCEVCCRSFPDFRRLLCTLSVRDSRLQLHFICYRGAEKKKHPPVTVSCRPQPGWGSATDAQARPGEKETEEHREGVENTDREKVTLPGSVQEVRSLHLDGEFSG